MDFMRDTLADGRVLRTLNIVDDDTARVHSHRGRYESARRARCAHSISSAVGVKVVFSSLSEKELFSLG